MVCSLNEPFLKYHRPAGPGEGRPGQGKPEEPGSEVAGERDGVEARTEPAGAYAPDRLPIAVSRGAGVDAVTGIPVDLVDSW